jgi:restriction system protein
LDQKTKSGDVLILNRIGWAKAYLKQAGMITQPQRALVEITDKGKEVLRKGSINLTEVLHDEEFILKRKSVEKRKEEEIDSNASPQDLIDNGIRSIETQVKIDLLAKLKTVDPYAFEKVILKLLEKMGYGEFIETPKSGDGGIDGILKQDQLGFEKIYIQAKRYTDTKIRETEIRNFIGAMSRDATKGVFVTTSTFDAKALEKARDASQKIIMIDGEALVDFMYKHSVGVQARDTYEVKELDEDFFEDRLV